MTGRVICKLYEMLDNNFKLQKELNYDSNSFNQANNFDNENKLSINNNEITNGNKNKNSEIQDKNIIFYRNNEI